MGVRLLKVLGCVDGKHNWGLYYCPICDREYQTRIRLDQPNRQSCGCRRPSYKHGEEIGGIPSRELRAYRKMRERCLSPACKDYVNYGARGITVCDRWLQSYADFLTDMGRKPGPEYSIERVDVNGPYAPENCIWATKLEQAKNTRTNVRITIEGRTEILHDWFKILNVSKSAYYRAVRRGEDPIDVLMTRGKRDP